MPATVAPILWEIWRKGRNSFAAITMASALSWTIDFSERAHPPERLPALHNEVLGFLSFLLLLSVFSYVDSSGDRGMGRFPRRLFTLPISTLELVTVPVVTGIVSIELLYALWMGRLAGDEPTNRLFVAVLLGAFVVFYQATLWMLEPFGPLRLVVLGIVSIAFFWIGFLPSSGEGVDSIWRTELAIGSIVVTAAVGQFLFVWRYIARVRAGGDSGGSRVGSMVGRLADALPYRRTGFRSARAAHFWFEWRCSGTGYLALVAGAVILLLGPASMFVGDQPIDVARVLVAALMPMIVAVPAGMDFSKPMFWSSEMSLPSLVSVLPLSNAELIAIKLRVAAVATVGAWLLVVGFLTAWLSSWADQESVHQILGRIKTVGGAGWLGMVVLIVGGAMLLTWRFLVVALWAGMSGKRALLMATLAPVGVAIIGAAIFDIGSLPEWIGGDLRRLTPFLVTGTTAVAVKLWLAARGARLTRRALPGWYLATWAVGVVVLLGLGGMILGSVEPILPRDDIRYLWLAVVLSALLLMPMARVSWAPWFLGRNRNRP